MAGYSPETGTIMVEGDNNWFIMPNSFYNPEFLQTVTALTAVTSKELFNLNTQ